MSPDGARIVCVDSSGNHVVSTSGGPAIRVRGDERVDKGVCWSPDGEWLWYSGGPTRMAKVPSQGGASVPINAGVEFAVHPRGERVLLSTGGDRYDLWMAKGFAQPATSCRRWFGHWAS